MQIQKNSINFNDKLQKCFVLCCKVNVFYVKYTYYEKEDDIKSNDVKSKEDEYVEQTISRYYPSATGLHGSCNWYRR